ncbi:hypothetical protein TWF506_003070 [Arthrobotrys conoides]|uniref:ubiquitinyl hydrolase 1 n=1 Tax=Arthrobotrys conoides TaxID=74498 RepID=A0AAN8NMQ3_9PEZI
MESCSMASFQSGRTALEAVFNHIVLPAQLPGQEDNEVDEVSRDLLSIVSGAIYDSRDLLCDRYHQQYSLVHQSLSNYQHAYVNGVLNKEILFEQFRSLQPKEQLIFNVTQQNAALLIHREINSSGDFVIFEAFETSPTSEKVLEVASALLWDFPGIAISVPYSKFCDTGFQEHLVLFLEQASKESIKRFAATSSKASSGAWESRDTVDPTLITDLLMTLLEAIGSRVFPSPLRKRVRDDVSWFDGINPWRRNPTWLILRVAVQKHLQLLLGPGAGTLNYKFMKCLLLRSFLNRIYPQADPEEIVLLKSKLCRRMAKLEIGRRTEPKTLHDLHGYLADRIGPRVMDTVNLVEQYTKELWERYRNRMERRVDPLPKRADPQDTTLSLPNSGAYLQNILDDQVACSKSGQGNRKAHEGPEIRRKGREDFALFADKYYRLFDVEKKLSSINTAYMVSSDPPDAKLIMLSRSLKRYLTEVTDLYNGMAEAFSEFILNVMDVWVSLDSFAIKEFPLLADFHPGFTAEILNSLHVDKACDFERLRKVGEYLKRRGQMSTSRMTIFADPCKGSFADRYVKSATNDTFRILQHRIEASAEASRLCKEAEWENKSEEYETLTEEMLITPCQYYLSDDVFPEQYHDDRGCRKCYLGRRIRRMRITAHEHPLPTDGPHLHATLFELTCPPSFAEYRDITWQIIATLALPSIPLAGEPCLLLSQYSGLASFHSMASPALTLGSSKKSFLQTHLAEISLPTTLERVCLPNGLSLAYYDTSRKVWPGRINLSTTFYHHFKLPIPENSPFASLSRELDPVHPPTSYEVIASQTRCPAGVNIHEFLAYQSLLSGWNRRFPSVLVELASSNLNFSTEATTLLVRYLTHQAGPPSPNQFLRMAHKIFTDPHFSAKLLNQIQHRLNFIHTNWREFHCMDMLIMLLSRCIDIWATTRECSVALNQAVDMLYGIREIIRVWLQSLQGEIDKAETIESSRRFSEFALWAAVLGRSTYFFHGQHKRLMTIDSTQLKIFIEFSIKLQQSLIAKPSSLPVNLRNALIHDLRIVCSIKALLRVAILDHPNGLSSALEIAWAQEEDAGYLPPNLLQAPDEWWVRMEIAATQTRRAQTILFHLLEGHLLLDGKPLGQLPPEHRNNPTIRELFGSQNLLTVPSRLLGMAYIISRRMNKHIVHLGFRGDKMIVRAEVNTNVILEYVPKSTFRSEQTEDLPASLLDGCYHWLNIRQRHLHIRKICWRARDSDWNIDLNQMEARRRTVKLVDRFSPLFKKVAIIFNRFEAERYLTVFQPEKRSLSVEMRRLELKWEVNYKGYLENDVLESYIDRNQDAGTWYGLTSKVVLMDRRNFRNRSIIVPLGPLRSRINGPHVEIDLAPNGSYGRYQINTILGRVDCPPEPRLLHTKALLHAYTSFILPDPLTGRTGTEEALYCLRSGYCQPWVPLALNHYPVLERLASLTPIRGYYPVGLKVMQKVNWNSDLRSYAQNEEFFFIIKEIIGKSDQLSPFSNDEANGKKFERENPELYKRSRIRRILYDRDSSNSISEASQDIAYVSRGQRAAANTGRQNVYNAVYHLDNWSMRLPIPGDLAGIMEKWQNIGGFSNILDKVTLSDKLNIDLPLFWGALVQICQDSDRADKYKLMFLFSMLVYNTTTEMDAIRVLILFATNPVFKSCEAPIGPSFKEFRRNPHIKAENIRPLIKPYFRSFSKADFQNTTGFALNPKLRRKIEAAEATFNALREKECNNLIDHLVAQWPCLQPELTLYFDNNLIDTSQVVPIIQPEWSSKFFNLQLSNYINEVQPLLDSSSLQLPTPEPDDTSSTDPEQGLKNLKQPYTRQCLNELLEQSTVNIPESLAALLKAKKEDVVSQTQHQLASSTIHPAHAREVYELEGIIREILQTDSVVRRRYATDLQQSIQAFKKTRPSTATQSDRIFPTSNETNSKIDGSRREVELTFDKIKNSLVGNDAAYLWLEKGNMNPCITVVSLLEGLRSRNKLKPGPGVREGLVLLGLKITALQRYMRLENFVFKNDRQKFSEDERNRGHQNWDPLKYPDWLLLEIDSNMLIRPDQVDVAHATIQPASGNNSVLQMNMGQGKTSCVMPMAAAVLADGKKLLRVVVPRALLLQTVQMIHARLGGLVGREVRHIPFSRQTPTSTEVMMKFHNIHTKIIKCFGLMVTLPEHTLSFMLSGLQRLSDGRVEEAKPMIRIQGWLNKVSRDLLDESDFTLAVKTQLIYPSGSQRAFDGHPHRWRTIEALLKLVEAYVDTLRILFPRSIEVVRRPGGYPFIYFLRRDAEENLIKRLADEISAGKTDILPMVDQTVAVQTAVKQFIYCANTSANLPVKIRSVFSSKPTVLKTIYLLRGLFVHRILLLALKKRWNVQYGLHPTRDPVAVPYYAKGVPSEQAEWGHPDVAILFTCLSFYYHGLNMDQLGQSLRFVIQSDDPASEYDRWTHSSNTLPDSLREWNSINSDDEVQLTEIWSHVRYNVVVINHFLNNFVFPKHAKQFLTKLQASGWDIPLFAGSMNNCDTYRKTLTTGFSGTNDNRTMLPLTVTQEDLPALSHTNAEVLTYLLQPRNREYILAVGKHNRRWSERDLLLNLSSKGIRILIDAGAQILEMDNLQLIEMWMGIDTQPPAAIYFDKNKPTVYYRNGNTAPLLATPYAEDSADCLIYLDESHTRGTDLKMPARARGALTLGLGQTKDHTVQAAMRLRQLGTTQSVTFFAPLEVHQGILDTRKTLPTAPVDSRDVVTWLLHQTCAGIEQLQPLYFSQGMDFCRRVQAASDNPYFLEDPTHLQEYLNTLRQPEQQSLRQMYEPKQGNKANATIQNPSTEIHKFIKELKGRRKGFQDTGEAVHGSALQEVEQEREVAFEVESVREVQKPVHYTPHRFLGLHEDLIAFVNSGYALKWSRGYEPAFLALRKACSLGEKYKIDYNYASDLLYASTEFFRTVHLRSGNFIDDFQRPVNWIIMSIKTNIAIIITPEEAEYLIPHLYHKSREPSVHLITYAAPINRRMVQFDTLGFFTIPPIPEDWSPPTKLSIELGIVAGRLYFTYEHSNAIKEYLNLVDEEANQEKSQAKAMALTSRPLEFLREWLMLKRKGQDFLHTPMGYLCQSKVLSQTLAFFKEDVSRLENLTENSKPEDIGVDFDDKPKAEERE